MGNCVDDLENQKREGGERKVRVNVVQSSLGGDFKMVWQVLNGRQEDWTRFPVAVQEFGELCAGHVEFLARRLACSWLAPGCPCCASGPVGVVGVI